MGLIHNVSLLGFVFACAIVLVFATVISKKGEGIRKALYIGAFLRFFFMYVFVFLDGIIPITNWPLADGREDARWFMGSAQGVVENGWAGIVGFLNLSSGVITYITVVATLLLVFAKSILAPLVLNCFLGLLTIKNCYKITSKIASKQAAINVAFVMALLPMQSVYSSIPVREVFVVYFLTLGIKYWVTYFIDKRTDSFAYACLSIIASALFHGGVIFIIPLFFIFYVFELRSNVFIVDVIRRVLAIGVAIGVITFLTTAGVGSDRVRAVSEGSLESDIVTRTSFFKDNRDKQYDKYTYIANVEINNMSDAIVWMPYLYFHFMARPYLWEYQADAIRLPNSYLTYLFFFLIITRFRHIWRNKVYRYLAITILLTAIVFASACVSVVHADRHRSKLIPLIVCFNGFYLHRLNPLTWGKRK